MNKFLIFLIFAAVIVLIEWDRHSKNTQEFEESAVQEKQVQQHQYSDEDFAEMESITPEGNSLVMRLIKANPPINSVEQSRNATVFLSTPWGNSGSGFILDEQCNAVTHKKLFEIDASKLLIERESMKKSISTIQQELKELEQEYGYVLEVEGTGDNSRRLDLEMRQLARLENKFESQLKKLDVSSTRNDFKAVLIDGTEYDISGYKLDEEYELAFFKLPEKHCPMVNKNCPKNLETNQPLNTIVNGVNSYYRMLDGEYIDSENLNNIEYFSMTTPVTPNNLGGPVLDSRGNVVGINSRVTSDEKSYALPMYLVEKAYLKYQP